jgi:predicted AAA+ superfamily ATPase
LTAYKDYSDSQFEIFYWRSTSQFEVDFVIRLKSKKLIGIEIKESTHIDSDDLKGFKAFEEDLKLTKKIIVCSEKNSRFIQDQFQVLPYQLFCKQLWAGLIV